jgi:hypothetical protein
VQLFILLSLLEYCFPLTDAKKKSNMKDDCVYARYIRTAIVFANIFSYEQERCKQIRSKTARKYSILKIP